MSIQRVDFGKLPSGEAVSLFKMKNNQISAEITNYGGIVVRLFAPDRDGNVSDIALGYSTLGSYLNENPFFGALIGRYGNRIGAGRFTLDGTEYTLAQNQEPNHLHGGNKGFDKVLWDAETEENDGTPTLVLKYTSEDGEEGYPGRLAVTVRYTLTVNDELMIEYTAGTDKTTVVNLTHHSYFNLAGEGKGDILGHRLKLHADSYTPTDDSLIPTGEISSVESTPMDFREEHAIGDRIHDDFPALNQAGGYDHNYIVGEVKNYPELIAEVVEPTSGRTLEVLTTEPAVQFYAGCNLDGTNLGKSGTYYKQYTGFCLEAQHYPDSPNQPEFPSTVLQPDQTYRQTTIYRFGVR